MPSLPKIMLVATALCAFGCLGLHAQEREMPSHSEKRSPNFCGAAGAGCDPAEVQSWKAVGNRLADLSSADLSQYAYACAKHHDWRNECKTDPVAVLKRLGINRD
jgi:hypothetical protein